LIEAFRLDLDKDIAGKQRGGKRADASPIAVCPVKKGEKYVDPLVAAEPFDGLLAPRTRSHHHPFQGWVLQS
jgi:hypothetical protein